MDWVRADVSVGLFKTHVVRSCTLVGANVMSATPGHLALEARGISKAYGHVQALGSVDLQLYRGEILGVVGDNGAGKSTLAKILSGAVVADDGDILVAGEAALIRNPQDARDKGIEMVFQDLALFNNLNVAANIFIGRELMRRRLGLIPFLDERRMHKNARALLERLGIHLQSTRIHVDQLSGGQRQLVAIVRAMAFESESKILLLDEPSAALGTAESGAVLHLIAELRNHGVSMLLISHRLPEVLATCDRVMVLKGGRVVATAAATEVTVEDVVDLIVSGTSARGKTEPATRSS